MGAQDEAELIAADIFGAGLPAAHAYVERLATTGVEWGLIGPREVDRLWSRHVLNSVAIEGLVAAGASVVDVGSGAGLPGVPLAIARPDLQVTLLEPLLRRANFLNLVVDELGLGDRVRVVRGRAEDTKATFDVVTARAVAPLGRLIGWTRPLFWPDGELLALKGSSAADEVAAAASELTKGKLRAEVLTVSAGADQESTNVVRVRAAGRG